MPSGFLPAQNFERDLKNDPEHWSGLRAIAKPAADAAKGLAPVAEGDYRDGIMVSPEGEKNVRVDAHDWKSALLEFGTEDTPVFACLRRGVRAAGLKLKESDR